MMPALRQHWPIVAAFAVALLALTWLLADGTPAVSLPPRPMLAEVRVPPIADVDAEQRKLFAPLPSEPDTTAVPEAPPPQLVGIVSRGRGRGIVLARDNQGDTASVAVGEMIDGWTLVAVRDAAAQFRMGGRIEAVALDFSNAALGGAVSAPTPDIGGPGDAAPPQLEDDQ